MPLDEEPVAELDLELTTRVGEVAHGVTEIEDAQEPRDASSLGTAILGAGPAGLTAAYVHAKRGAPATVFEADGTVGGIAKTIEFEGYRFDLGGHRFYTKLEEVRRLWEQMLGTEFLTRPLVSRIYYYSGPSSTTRCGPRTWCAGSAWWYSSLRDFLLLLAPPTAPSVTPPGRSRSGWCADLGAASTTRFFRSYTEKVWGIPGSEIQSEWAAQRIQEFSLWQAVLPGPPLTLLASTSPR